MANIGPDEFLGLSDQERTERTAALSAISRARRLGVPVEDAASELGTPMGVVRRWADRALRRGGDGRTYPTPSDDLYRLRPIGLDDSMGFIGVNGSDEAEEAERIFQTQYDFNEGRASVDDLRRLPEWFANRRVVRDPRVLDRLAREGQLDIPELYREIMP